MTVGLGFRGRLTSTAPVPDRETRSWTVTAEPDGTLTDAAGRCWPYLFWEGLGCVPTSTCRWHRRPRRRGGRVPAHSLAERGLTAAENAAFRQYWVPRLSANPWVLIHFEGATYESYVPLHVTPSRIQHCGSSWSPSR